MSCSPLAYPGKGNSASRDRFLSQFLARVTRGGEVYPGAVCQYQLARFEDAAIVLTNRGLEFSRIEESDSRPAGRQDDGYACPSRIGIPDLSGARMGSR